MATSLNSRKELFSEAYVDAVASASGCVVHHRRKDYDGIDVTIDRPGLTAGVGTVKLDIQLKCTADDRCLLAKNVRFALDKDNYNQLAYQPTQAPRMLVVVVVPKRLKQWLTHTETELALRNCGYWLWFQGQPLTANRAKKTVYLPRSHLFNPRGLKAIMRSIGRNGHP